MDADHTPVGPAPTGLTRAGAIVRLILLAGGLGVLLAVSLRQGPDLASIRAFVDDSGWWAPVIFVVTYAALTVALVPGAVLTAAAGLLFGVAVGTGLTVVGATLGAAGAFLVARAAGRRAVDRLTGGRVARVDDWLRARGLLAVLTLRLVPLVPFSAANYAAGVTSVRFTDFVVGTVVGIVPGTVVYTALGARAEDPTGPAFVVAVGALVLLAVFGSVLLRRAGRRTVPTAASPVPFVPRGS